VRLLPVAIAFLGTRARPPTVGFVGWFGPRGLASVVFGLIAADTLVPADGRLVLSVVTVTVTLSVLLHGVTASPLARRYARVETLVPPDTSGREVAPLATRPLTRRRAYFHSVQTHTD
jgi:sodium/hydrogen antiporter